MKNLILPFVILGLFLVSCEREGHRSDYCFGQYVDHSVVLGVQNEFGEDLLDENHPDYINLDSVFLYRIAEDGCEVRLYNQYSDISKAFRLVTTTGKDRMLEIVLTGNGIAMAHMHDGVMVYENNTSIVYRKDCTLLLKWDTHNQNTDTIYTTFVQIEATEDEPLIGGYCTYSLYDKVYYNGEEIVSSWDDNMDKINQHIYPVIIK